MFQNISAVFYDKIALISGEHSDTLSLNKETVFLSVEGANYTPYFSNVQSATFTFIFEVQSSAIVSRLTLEAGSYSKSIESIEKSSSLDDLLTNKSISQDVLVIEAIISKLSKLTIKTITNRDMKAGVISMTSTTGISSNHLLVYFYDEKSSELKYYFTVPSHKSALKFALILDKTREYKIIAIKQGCDNKFNISLKRSSTLSIYILMVKKLRFSKITNTSILSTLLFLLRLILHNKISSLANDYYQIFDKRRNSYSNFIQHVEPRLIKKTLLPYQKLLRKGYIPPCFTIISIVKDETLDVIRRCFESIRSQYHTNWTWLVILKHTNKKQLTELFETDNRIHILESTGSKAEDLAHIYENYKIDYLIFFALNGIFSHSLLCSVVLAVSEHSDAHLFYTDEDFLNGDERHTPQFKPDFNNQLFKEYNYLNNICIYSGQLLAKYQEKHILRNTNLLPLSEIIHIPIIGFHNFTHTDRETKSPLIDMLRNKPKYLKTCTDTKVSIVIPFRDHPELLINCVSSIYDTTDSAKFELILVNNNSIEDKTKKLLYDLKQKQNIQIVTDSGDFNFSRLINLGVCNAKHKVILLLNNDIEATEAGWLEELFNLASSPHNGAIGCQLLYPDTTIQHSGILLSKDGKTQHIYGGEESGYSQSQIMKGRYNVFAVTAACMAVRKELFIKLGGFDETFEVSYNDVDFCMKAVNAGYNNVITEYIKLTHFESKSRGRDITKKQRSRYLKEQKLFVLKWREILQSRRLYHPSLDPSFADFSTPIQAHHTSMKWPQ